MSRKQGFAAIAAVAALGCWLFAGALFSGKILGGDDLMLFSPPFRPPPGLTHPSNPLMYDSAWVFHPDMLEAREDLRGLHLPIWNPWQGAGQPLLASQQAAVFYPPNWLSSVLPFWPSLEWVALLKLLIAGGGMLLFGRALGLRTVPALFGAVSFAFSTYTIDWFAHPHSNVFVLLPWLMLSAERVAAAARPRDTFLLALVVGLALLGGHPESAFLVLLATALWFAFRTATVARDRSAALRRLLLGAGALGLGLGVAAVVLIPFGEMLEQAGTASRSGGPGPTSILQGFIVPEHWGRPDKFSLPGGPLNYAERTAYFGALPLLFAVAGLAIRPTRTQIFFLVLGLLAIGLVVNVPVYSSLAAGAPGLDLINRFRALVLCAFAGAILGAFGLQAILESSATARRRMAIAVAAAAATVLFWLAYQVDWAVPLGSVVSQLPVLGHARQAEGVVASAAALRWAILAVVAVALAVVAAWRPRYATAVALIALALTAVDLVTLDRGFIPAINPAYAAPPTPASVRYAQSHVGHQRVGGGTGLIPNMAERYDLRGSRIHALPALKRRNDLWFGLGGRGAQELLALSPRRLASLFAVKYVFVDPRTHIRDPRTQRVAAGLYVNRGALPRAWLSYGWTRASGVADAVQTLSDGSRADDFRRPVVEGVRPPASVGTAGTDPVTFEHDADTSVELRVHAARPGLVVLGDTYYPGWDATVDGRSAAIHPTNVAFRGVLVPAGTHTVRFDYRPQSVRVGGLISLFALVAIVAGLVLTSPRVRIPRTVRRARRQPA